MREEIRRDRNVRVEENESTKEERGENVGGNRENLEE